MKTSPAFKTATRALFSLALITLFLIGVDWILEVSELTRMIYGPQAQWPGMRGIAGPIAAMMVGIAAVMLPILAAAAWTLVGRDDSIEAKTADGDIIHLMPESVEKVVSRDVNNAIDEVLTVTCDSRQGPEASVMVTVRVRLVDSAPIPGVSARVRKETEKTLERLFGLTGKAKVRVIVHDVKLSKPARRKTPQGKRPAGPGQKKRRPRPEAPAPAPPSE